MSSPGLLIAGNLLVDDLVFADGKTRMGEAGGAVLYAALSASLWSSQIACLSRRGDDYPPDALSALAERGVDLSGVQPLGRTGGRTWLLYEGTQWRMVPRLGGPSHEEVSPAPSDVPPAWRSARGVHLAPMPLGCQAALCGVFADSTFISLDPHVPIRPDTLPLYAPILSRIDALFLGEEELDLPEKDAQPAQVLSQLCSRGSGRSGRLRYVAWKRGAAGGLLYDAHADKLLPWAARAKEVVDPTGCGDAFAASFVSAILDGACAARAIERGLVGCSFALAGFGATALLQACPASAHARLKDFGFPSG